MIDRSVFYARLELCKVCEFWKGACLKGHVLQGSLGCPVQKFEGVAGSGYMEDMPVPVPETPPEGGTGCCGSKAEGDIKPLSWVSVWQHLAKSIHEWKTAGYPLTPAELYLERLRICKDCPSSEYRWFQCRQCKCIVYTKAKLATEVCPHGFWPAV